MIGSIIALSLSYLLVFLGGSLYVNLPILKPSKNCVTTLTTIADCVVDTSIDLHHTNNHFKVMEISSNVLLCISTIIVGALGNFYSDNEFTLNNLTSFHQLSMAFILISTLVSEFAPIIVPKLPLDGIIKPHGSTP
jgi:hypothetical protein